MIPFDLPRAAAGKGAGLAGLGGERAAGTTAIPRGRALARALFAGAMNRDEPIWRPPDEADRTGALMRYCGLRAPADSVDAVKRLGR